MKLLFIIFHIANCGAERVLALVANELSRRGYKVYILTNPRRVTYQLDKEITLLDAYGQDYVGGGRLHNLLFNLKGFYRLHRAIKTIRPDFIISFMGMFIWQLLLYRRKHKVIISDHTAINASFGRKRDIERRYLPRFFYRYIVLTQSDKDYLQGRLNNVSVIGNPLSFSPISTREYEALFPDRRDLLVCASVDRWHIKGLDNMIRSFALCKQSHPSVKLFLAGAGGDESIGYLTSLAKELQVSDSVVFLGYSSDVDVLMKRYAILICPSRVEGFGMSITEAMACGLPVVSYSLTGPKEIITDHHDGLLVENQSIEKLAEAISSLVDNDDLRYSLGIHALETAKRFSVASVVDKWETVFNEAK